MRLPLAANLEDVAKTFCCNQAGPRGAAGDQSICRDRRAVTEIEDGICLHIRVCEEFFDAGDNRT